MTLVFDLVSRLHYYANTGDSTANKGFALNTVVLWPNINALQHTFWQTATPTALCYSANQADSSLVAQQTHQWIEPLKKGL